MRRIVPSTLYDSRQLTSTGRASCMLLRQHDFPTSTYDEKKDVLVASDSDRLKLEHIRACCRKHLQRELFGITYRIRTTEISDETMIAFLKEALTADPTVLWTGYRVLGSVHLGDGFPVFTFELFAKHPETDTEVQSEY